MSPSSRTAQQLPPGRHGLSRAFVTHHQAERIVRAGAEVLYDVGYAEMSVQAVIACAGVSRRTFYDLYRDKTDLMLAMIDRAGEGVGTALATAVPKAAGPDAEVAAVVDALLGFASREPHIFLMLAMAAAPDRQVFERRERIVRQLGLRLVVAGEHVPPRGPAAPSTVAHMLVGEVSQAIYRRLVDRGATRLPALLPDLVFLCLAPQCGRREALRARRRLRYGGAAHAPA
jgi:AcrR family transcriptional regulator